MTKIPSAILRNIPFLFGVSSGSTVLVYRYVATTSKKKGVYNLGLPEHCFDATNAGA